MRALRLILLGLCLSALPNVTLADIHASHYRAFSSQFQLLLELDTGTGAETANGAIFSPSDSMFGLAFVGGVLYGAGYDGSKSYLATLPHQGAATGSRVSTQPIAASGGVEALAYDTASGKLYGALWDFSHNCDLLEINPSTGEGTVIGRLSTDVIVTGMTFVGGTLYAVAKPWATRTGALYTIDPSTATESLIANLSGLAPASGGFGPLESLTYADGKLIGGWKALYEIDMSTAAGTLIGGDFATNDARDGLFGLANQSTGVSNVRRSWGELKSLH